MAKCLQTDPRRRFVFGFTIEDAHMRLWYLDRVQLVVSASFNYLTVSFKIYSYHINYRPFVVNAGPSITRSLRTIGCLCRTT